MNPNSQQSNETPVTLDQLAISPAMDSKPAEQVTLGLREAIEDTGYHLDCGDPCDGAID